MIDENESMRQRIQKLCGKDKSQLKKIFDEWRIFLDPNIDAPLARERERYAKTDFTNQYTQFNYRFFNQDASDPGTSFTFAHEFRHLMNENNNLVNDASLGSVLSGRPNDALSERDADAWARKFLDKNCVCGFSK